MAAAKIKKGDQVIVLSGKDKGKTGEVTQVDAEGRQGRRVGRQRRRRATRKPSQANPQGGLERSKRRCTSRKVAHVTADGKPTRVRFEDAGRQEGPRRREDRGDDQWLMQLHAAHAGSMYDDTIVKAMTEKFGYKNVDGSAAGSTRSC